MSSFIELIQEEINNTKDPDLTYIISELSEDLSEVPTVNSGFNVTPNMVVVVAVPQEHDCDKKYYIDANSLIRYAQNSQQPIPQAYDQVVEKNCIKKEDTCLLLQDINIEECSNAILYAPNEKIRQSRLEGLMSYSNLIHSIKEQDISIVRVK